MAEPKKTAAVHITASTPLSPLLVEPGMQRVLEKHWDPYLIQKKHMVADRHDKSARWLPDLKSSLKAKKRNKFRPLRKRQSSKSKRNPFRSGRSLFRNSFSRSSQNRTSPASYRRSKTAMPKSSFLQRTRQGPIAAANSLGVMRRIETFRVRQKNELDAAVKIQSAYRNFARNTTRPAAAQTNSQSSSAAADAQRSPSKPRRLAKKRSSKKGAKKARRNSRALEAPKESKSETLRRQWIETFKAQRKAEKAAARKARREIRRAEQEADRAEQEREEFMMNLRQSLSDSTVYYHDLYSRTVEKVRSELTAAGHEAAVTKMQSVWRMSRARKELANKEAMAQLTEEDMALLEAVYGTRDIRDVDVEKIQADLEEARGSLSKIQATVRGRISREEVAVLRRKLREDAAKKSKAATGTGKLGADDNFLLMAMYDDDMTNTLDAKELRNFLADLDMSSSDESIRALMAKMDRDGDGTVDFQELIQTLPPHILDKLRGSGYVV